MAKKTLKKNRSIFRSVLRIGVVIALLPILLITFVRIMDSSEHRFALYDVMNSLKYHMPRTEVEKVISKNNKPYVRQSAYGAAEIRLSVKVGVAQELYLFLAFRNGKLESAIMHGEDNPDDRFKDQPQDILGPGVGGGRRIPS